MYKYVQHHLLSTIKTIIKLLCEQRANLVSQEDEYAHWFPSWAPNDTSILASCRLLLRTATSSGDSPSLFTLKINTLFV